MHHTSFGTQVCERFILGQIQPFLEKSNDQNLFTYKKARSTLDAVGLLAHTIARCGSKLHKPVLWILAVLLIPPPRSQIFDRPSSQGAPSWTVRWLLSFFTNW